jgi:hypothetical protein
MDFEHMFMRLVHMFNVRKHESSACEYKLLLGKNTIFP